MAMLPMNSQNLPTVIPRCTQYLYVDSSYYESFAVVADSMEGGSVKIPTSRRVGRPFLVVCDD